MTLLEFTEAMELQIEMCYPDVNGLWYVSWRSADVKDGNTHTHLTGRGITPDIALNDFTRQVRGKRMVVKQSQGFKEFKVPNLDCRLPQPRKLESETPS